MFCNTAIDRAAHKEMPNGRSPSFLAVQGNCLLISESEFLAKKLDSDYAISQGLFCEVGVFIPAT
jgi:hypothetical protein